MNELFAAGMTQRAVAAASGLSVHTLHALSYRLMKRILPSTEQAILSVPLRQVPTRAGTVRRVQALLALGWPHSIMKSECGRSTAAVLHDDRFNSSLALAFDIAAMYDRLSMKPGPSKLTRGQARNRGYLPPLVWDDDDIDDPAAVPQTGEDGPIDEVQVERAMRGQFVRLTRVERREVVRRLTDRGVSAAAIGASLGLAERTVHRLRSDLRHDEGAAA